MLKEYQNIINAICDRFENALSQLDIVLWLENFDKSDWKKALIVLNSFEYYSTKDIVREFDIGLKSIISEIGKEKKVFLVPIGNTGKSGMAMIYYLKKTLLKNTKIKIIEDNDFSQVDENSNLILVDDFSGTGNTVITYYNNIKHKFSPEVIPYVLTIAFMEKAQTNLKEINLKIFGNKRNSVFLPRGSVFGYYPKMKAIREFCFKYGDKIYPEEQYNTKKTLLHPLGYANSQTLLGFEHSIPNNTLPIIWADCTIKGTKKKWHPIFPRRGALIIEKAKEFKQQQRYWTSILYKLGLGDDISSSGIKYDCQTIQFVSIISLKKRRKNVPNICQMLGINLNDYNKIIQEGQTKNLFNSEGELSEIANNIYDEIQKKIKFEKHNFIKTELIIEEDLLYLPNIFRGSS